MARLIVHTERTPLAVDPPENGKKLYLCRCGLSANGAFCDGTHAKIPDEDESRLYRYERVDGQLVPRDTEA